MIHRAASSVGVGLGLGLGVVACVAPMGGWDVAAVLANRPELAAIEGQRLGDLTPYPALPAEGESALRLVVCRFPDEARVLLQPSGAEWPGDVADRALGSLGAERLGIDLRLAASHGEKTPPRVRAGVTAIRIRSIAAPEAAGPGGLGDTLMLCDVAEDLAAATGPRGELVAGVIRLRRRLPQPTGRVHVASDEEWAAAFLHELAHLLGFAGHAAAGDSPVHREQSQLRALARRALGGEVLAAPNLRALYGLSPGAVLGRAVLAPEGARVVSRIRALVAARSARVGLAEGPLASVGDREARIAWRWPDGVAVAVRFPRYVEQLRAGESISAEPDARTRRLLEGAPSSAERAR